LSNLVLVDADGLLYLAGAIGEKREYHAVFEDEDGEVHDIHRDSAAEVKEFGIEHPDLTFVEKDLIVTPGPLEHCLQVVKTKLKEMQRKYGPLEVYVKGDGTNFRDDVSTIVKYKGNRTAVKPYWLEEIRQYLIVNWNAIEISGKEADDAIATRAFEASKSYVVCSPDKDLNQIPGKHWNYSKNVEFEIDPDEAREFFWQQVLSGDTADNIKGCWKIGEGKATDLVAEWIGDQLSDEEIWPLVVEVYDISKAKPGCPYPDLAPDVVAVENARLVWMQTENLRLWTPPGVPAEYMKGDLDD
jgi:hypothetical protein